MQQLSLSLELLDSKPNDVNWFENILNTLEIRQETGWTDKFGKHLRKWLQQKDIVPVKTLSLFSGGGVLDIAFHDSGFEIVQMVELEAKYIQTLPKNSQSGKWLEDSKPICTDIRDYSPDPNLNVDFIIGGPPCQTFSAAGRRAAGVSGTSDARGTLFQEYVRILKLLQPKGFLFENVYGIRVFNSARFCSCIMSELHLRVYANRSELILPDGTVQTFHEGGMNQATKARYSRISAELSNGYLERQILACRDRSSNLDFSELTQAHRLLLEDRQILESWDAKYGKSYLRDEIEELSEKLDIHPAIRRAGFVTSLEPERLDELEPRCEEIEEIYGISLEILTFEKWVEEQFERSLLEETVAEQELAVAWMTAYTESLAQQRREIAPIDEPCYQWLLTMNQILKEEIPNMTTS
jgi:hypothetical protein